MQIMSKSRTNNFNVIMLIVHMINLNIQAFQPLMTTEMFIAFSGLIATAHTVGGLYFRKITTKPLSKL